MTFYNKQGQRIPVQEFLTLLRDPSYKQIANTNTPDGKRVSTVWLGTDYGPEDNPPRIFETMVFPSDGTFDDLDSAHYTTEEEAIAGHKLMVEKWT